MSAWVHLIVIRNKLIRKPWTSLMLNFIVIESNGEDSIINSSSIHSSSNGKVILNSRNHGIIWFSFLKFLISIWKQEMNFKMPTRKHKMVLKPITTLFRSMQDLRTYTGAHGIDAEKLRVSKNVFDSITDRTRLGRCWAKSWAKKPPRDVPYICIC